MRFTINGTEFLDTLRPALESGDLAQLACTIVARWRPKQLCGLLRHQNKDVRRAAALAIGTTGDSTMICTLAQGLHDPDPQVHGMVEHAMWSIWFRGGSRPAVCHLNHGMTLMAAGMVKEAVGRFAEAMYVDPQFTEAANQRAIAGYLLGNWESSLEDCRVVVQRVPWHFGAHAGMGHCRLQIGEIATAMRCYRRALHINPRLDGVAETV